MINIHELAKMMSDVNKSKIIIHFFSCDCHKLEVNTLCSKWAIEQSNLSKHLNTLNAKGVLSYVQEHRKKYYYMPEEFKEEWKSILEPMAKHKDLRGFNCSCLKNC